MDINDVIKAKDYLVDRGVGVDEKIKPLKVAELMAEYHESKVNVTLGDVSKCLDMYKKLVYPENFRILRKMNGYTQVSFSNKIGIKRATYAAYEEGRTEPPISVIYKICCSYGVTIDDILTKELKANVC